MKISSTIFQIRDHEVCFQRSHMNQLLLYFFNWSFGLQKWNKYVEWNAILSRPCGLCGKNYFATEEKCKATIYSQSEESNILKCSPMFRLWFSAETYLGMTPTVHPDRMSLIHRHLLRRNTLRSLRNPLPDCHRRLDLVRPKLPQDLKSKSPIDSKCMKNLCITIIGTD